MSDDNPTDGDVAKGALVALTYIVHEMHGGYIEIPCKKIAQQRYDLYCSFKGRVGTLTLVFETKMKGQRE